jgi:hypothetical protein
MAERGAWRLDGGARRVETIAPSSPPPVLLGRRPTSPCNAPTLPCHRPRRGDVGDAGGVEPACTDAPDGARPRGERKDALDTVALRRCRAQVVASIAAAAVATVGVKPQAEAPHSAPVAPRNALRGHLRRRTCTARARAQRHRSVLRARAGPTWESARSSSVARARQGARRKGRASRWQMERWLGAPIIQLFVGPPTRLEPAAARRRRRQKKVGRTDKKLNYWCSQPGPQKGVSPAFLWEHQDFLHGQ